MNQILLCLLIGLAAANAAGQNPITIMVDIFRDNIPPTQEGITNQMDQCLVETKNLVKSNGFYKNFNPLSLPNITEPVLLGQLKLTEVKLYGFDSIYRYGDVTVTYDNSSVYLKTQQGFKELNINSKYALNILILPTQGNFSAKVTNFVYSFSARMNRRTFKVDLTDFKVIKNGSVAMNLEGQGLIDSLVALVVNLLSSFFNENGLVGREVKLVIQDLIKQHNTTLPSQ